MIAVIRRRLSSFSGMPAFIYWFAAGVSYGKTIADVISAPKKKEQARDGRGGGIPEATAVQYEVTTQVYTGG